jgi:glucuronyl/N-acetylglucosaminyl transferase EXT2
MGLFGRRWPMGEATFSVVLANVILAVTLLAVLEPRPVGHIGARGRAAHFDAEFTLLSGLRRVDTASPANKGRHNGVRTSAVATAATPTDFSCTRFTCLDTYRCGVEDGRLQVFIAADVATGRRPSRQFVQALAAVAASSHLTHDPNQACVVIPAVDTSAASPALVDALGSTLAGSPLWDRGGNHLILSWSPAAAAVPRGEAMLAAPGLHGANFRANFDISLPALPPQGGRASNASRRNVASWTHSPRWLVLVHQIQLERSLKEDLAHLRLRHPGHLAIVEDCGTGGDLCLNGHKVTLDELAAQAAFCIVGPTGPGRPPDSHALAEVMSVGCVPVLVSAEAHALPFAERLDWTRFAVLIRRADVTSLLSTLGHVPPAQVLAMKRMLESVFEKYMSSPENIVLTALRILEERLFPQLRRSRRRWTPSVTAIEEPLPPPPPPVLDHYRPSYEEGFTAVILTYNRPESLFILLQRLAEVPSLAAVLVVWNNPDAAPPPQSQWPSSGKPVQLIRTSANLLSDRFFPYAAIATDCVLSLDDDIVMLTADELEFGYRVWLEHPDRLVGFPSRTHVVVKPDGSEKESFSWRYESEWTNDVSMVLTGAAFYHVYWHWAYTAAEDGSPLARAKAHADAALNCEDIAFNFMVAAATGKAPIKVGPRKKFRAANAASGLSTELATYLEARSHCVNLFATWYGHMPLVKAEFRGDPLLFKEGLPVRLQRYPDLGTL